MLLDDFSFARLRLLAPMLDDVPGSHEIDIADQAAHLDDLGARRNPAGQAHVSLRDAEGRGEGRDQLLVRGAVHGRGRELDREGSLTGAGDPAPARARFGVYGDAHGAVRAAREV